MDQNGITEHTASRQKLDLCRFIPCLPAFFDLLISLGQQGLITLRFKGGPTLGSRRVIPYSAIKSIKFSFQPIRRHYSESCCCSTQTTVDETWSSSNFDASILLPQRKISALKVCILRFVGQDNIILSNKSLLFANFSLFANKF